jgi:transcriptional regulator with XRE-family HTH domain
MPARALIEPAGAMNRIRAARQAQGWTQNDLADRSGVSARTIHAIEKGRPCRQATKRKILRTLGVPWDLRSEYFPGARKVRRPLAIAEVEQARTA